MDVFDHLTTCGTLLKLVGKHADAWPPEQITPDIKNDAIGRQRGALHAAKAAVEETWSVGVTSFISIVYKFIQSFMCEGRMT